MTIKTTASIKKITSGKGVEIVLCLPSSVSLDDLNELKQRDEFYLALGISQMEIKDYIEPRRGLQVVTNAGAVETIKSSDDENQLAIDDVEVEETEAVEESEDTVAESEGGEGEQSDIEAVVDSEELESVEADSEVSEDDIPFTDTDDMDAEDDPDAPLTFLDQE